MTQRLGFDIGGTFTDFALYDEATGELRIGKRLTTPTDPSIGALAGIHDLLTEHRIGIGDLTHAVHGTTVAANALIERKGAKTALLTTLGFRDILEIGRSKRHSLYDLQVDKVRPLVPRELRLGVRERIAADGTVLTPLDEVAVHEIARKLKALGVRSLAICFLHSYRNPIHESQAFELLRSELGPEVSISLSHEVSPKIREFERASTTAANAYVAPIVRNYLTGLEEGLHRAGYTGNLHVMQSNGGIASLHTAAQHPIRIVESGPAAGALVAALYGKMAGFNNLLSFDMGGTTAKLCLIEEGAPQFAHVLEVDKDLMRPGSGIPLNIQAIDLVEIGAGGGSIAKAEAGILKVGPESAGADPGPICYGGGGSRPTVTDSDLVLGYLNPDYFLGGRMGLALGAAKEGLKKDVADPLGVDMAMAAWGIHHIVNTNMEGAAREVTVQRGRDPRDYSMVAFGGAGPVHAIRIAKNLGLPRVLVPMGAGVTSAIGLLAAKPKFDLVRSFVTTLDPEMLPGLNGLFVDMEAEAAQMLQMAGAAGHYVVQRSAHMRYVGQGYDIEVPVPSGHLGLEEVVSLRSTFEDVYRRLYGYGDANAPVRATDWYVSVTGSWPELKLAFDTSQEPGSVDGARATSPSRPVYFPEAGGYTDCPVYDRYRLHSGMAGDGPAIVEERESTTVIPPGCRWRVDAYRTLIIEFEADVDA
jgi:N-methylhydantoinase A